MLVVGIAWGFMFPVVKDIWSSTFVLVTSGIATLALAGLSYAFDGRPAEGIRRVLDVGDPAVRRECDRGLRAS